MNLTCRLCVQFNLESAPLGRILPEMAETEGLEPSTNGLWVLFSCGEH